MKGDSHCWSLLASLIFVAACFAWATGRWSPHHVADTPSYLQYPFDSLAGSLNSIRTPGYPLFVSIIRLTMGLSAVPAMQWLIACVAAWWFAIEMGRWSASTIAVWGSAFSIVFGCTSLDHQSTVSTDALAASIGVCSVTCLLRWIRRGRGFWDGVVIVGFCFTAIMIRPAYLAIIVWVAAMGTLLKTNTKLADAPEPHHTIGFPGRLISSLWVAGACLSLVLGWMTLRWIVVNDFGMLPFGHQNLAGVTLQLVSDEELFQLAKEDPAGEIERLVNAFVNQRRQALTNGFEFQSGPGLPTMTMENQWNDLIYQAVVPATIALSPDDPIERHRLIGRMNRLIVQRYPHRYVHWLLLSARRSIWGIAADLLMNPVFLTVGGLLATVWFCIAIQNQGRDSACISVVQRMSDELHPADRCDVRPSVGGTSIVTLAALVAFSYAAVMIGFVILSSPPLGRFADAGAILIPSWLVIWVSEATRFRSIVNEKLS